MLGVTVNSLAVILGGLLGLFFRKILPKKIENAVMTAIALCIFLIGAKGLFDGKKVLITILSMVLGAVVGTLLDLDKQLGRLGDFVQSRFSKKAESGRGSLSEAFVYSTLAFCVGAMAITGGLDAGLRGDNTTFYAKAILDSISAVFFTSSLGVGVLLSCVPLFIYQSLIVLLAEVLRPLLTVAVIAEMSVVGSLLLVALAFNLLGLTKIKIINYIPAIFFPILFCLFL